MTTENHNARLLNMTKEEFLLYLGGNDTTIEQKYSIIKCDSEFIVLDTGLIQYFDEEWLSANKRLEDISEHPAVSGWAMYHDGIEHKRIRADSIHLAAKLNSTARAIRCNGGEYLNSRLIREFLMECYANTFSEDTSLIVKSLDTMEGIHHAVLHRDNEELEKNWNKLKAAFGHLSVYDLSLMCFIITDTLPSITHATIALALALEVSSDYDSVDPIQVLSETPPFKFVTRTANTSFYCGGIDFNLGDKILFSTESPQKSQDLVFGFGAHSCPGKKVTLNIAEKLARTACSNGISQVTVSETAGTYFYCDLDYGDA